MLAVYNMTAAERQQLRQRRSCSMLLLFAGALLLISALAKPAAAAPSPTGRTPKLYWTPARQDTWNRMVSENNSWWQYIKRIADESEALYGDLGDMATLAYQMTGSQTYARTAWTKMKPTIDTMRPHWNSRNGTREETEDWVWRYDWLYPALTAEERALFITYLNTLADLILNNTEQPGWGTRLGDSDETVGHYFGLAFIAAATGPENPRAASLLQSTWPDGSVQVKPVGGLEATAADHSTMRNGVRALVELASGGTWLESSNYNQGTLQLLLLGREGLRTATGADHFPEIAALLPDIAQVQIQQLAPDLRDSAQWGDEQNPQQLRLYSRLPLTGIIAGSLPRPSSLALEINRLAADFAGLGSLDSFAARPYARFFLLYDPYEAQQDWRSTPMRDHYSARTGHVYYRTGWQASDSFVHLHLAARTPVDHEVAYTNNFRLWRKGEWAVNHPFGYGIVDGGGTTHTQNTMLFAGLSTCGEARGPIAREAGADYLYAAGAMGGAWPASAGYYDPPPPFVNEWSRSFLYLPAESRSSDVLVIYDRTDIKNPLALPKANRYYPSLVTEMQGAAALKQWIIHTPVSPVLTPQSISWQTSGGQQLKLTTLLPAAQQRTVIDETSFDMRGSIYPEQRKWQVRITPAHAQLDPGVTARYYDNFLNMLAAYDAGNEPAGELLRSTGGEAEGVLVRRSGEPDTAILFSARQGAEIPATPLDNGRQAFDAQMLGRIAGLRLLQAGYAVSLQSLTSEVQVFIADLKPDLGWRLVDNGTVQALRPSAQGLARATLSGSGQHDLVLISGSLPSAPANLRVQEPH